MRSEGSVPESDLEARLMEVTRLELSHLTPFHSQKEVVSDQPVGVGERDLTSSDMTAASSAMAVVARRERKKKVEREARVCSLNRSIRDRRRRRRRRKGETDFNACVWRAESFVHSSRRKLTEGKDRPGELSACLGKCDKIIEKTKLAPRGSYAINCHC